MILHWIRSMCWASIWSYWALDFYSRSKISFFLFSMSYVIYDFSAEISSFLTLSWVSIILTIFSISLSLISIVFLSVTISDLVFANCYEKYKVSLCLILSWFSDFDDFLSTFWFILDKSNFSTSIVQNLYFLSELIMSL